MGALIRRRIITRKDLENALYAILGEKKDYTDKLSQKIRKILGVKYVILTISGYSALRYILKMFIEKIGIKKIFVPVYAPSFYSKILINFSEYVSLVDIDKESLLPIGDFKDGDVVLFPGYFGIVREDKPISNATIIDDLSKSIGGFSYNKVAGSFSDIGFLHLDDTSILFGDSAGIIFTNNSYFYTILKEYIQNNSLSIKPYQSAIILSQIAKLNERIKLRKEKAKKIASFLQKANITPIQRALKDGSTFLEIPFLFEYEDSLKALKNDLVYSPIEKPVWEDMTIEAKSGFPNTFYFLSKLYAIHINPYFSDTDIINISKSLVVTP